MLSNIIARFIRAPMVTYVMSNYYSSPRGGVCPVGEVGDLT